MAWRVRAVWCLGALAQLGCGSTASHSSGAGGAGGNSPGGGGGSSGAGAGGVTNAGSAGIAGSGGGATASACMSRSTNQLAGTRIKYHVLRTSEGDEAWNGFYDTMTGEDCYAAVASDGKTRCMPISRQPLVYYADPACTDRVYDTGDPTCGSFGYLQEADPNADVCKPTYQLYKFGEAFTGTAYASDAQGGCFPNPVTTLHLARKGALVDPAQYAELEPAELPEPGRIGRVGYKSADGAFLVQGYKDNMFDTECSFARLRDGKQHCVPAYNYLPTFSDGACMMPLLGVSTACGAKARQYFTRSEGDGCNHGAVVIKTDQVYTGSTSVIDPTSGMCVTQGQPPVSDVTLYTSTDVPDSAVPEFTYTTLDNDPGRLKPMYRTSTDGSCSFYDFRDSELKVECYFHGDAKTGYYCYPDVPADSPLSAFSDAGCTTAVQYLVAATCFAGDMAKYTANYASAGCSYQLEAFHALSAGVVGSAASFFQGAPGSCTPLSVDPELTYFTLGPELPASMFVSAQTTTP